MKQIQVTVYEFGELSEKAKDRVRYDMQASYGYSWNTEALASLKALAEHFDGKLTDWSIDWFDSSPSSATFDMPEDMTPEELKAKIDALGTYDPETLKGNGDCLLTGYGADEDAIDGLRRAYHAGERNLKALMQAAFKTWLKACQDDAKYQYSDEGLAETCEANDYLFLENGKHAPRK